MLLSGNSIPFLRRQRAIATGAGHLRGIVVQGGKWRFARKVARSSGAMPIAKDKPGSGAFDGYLNAPHTVIRVIY